MPKTKKNKSNRKKLTIISIIILGVALLIAAAIYIFNIMNSDEYRLKPWGWTTYQNTDVPFKFNRPGLWSLRKESLNDKTTLIASSDGKDIASIMYNIADKPIAEGLSDHDPDCRNKQARSVRLEDACSYIVNDSMLKGYFYSDVRNNIWRGEYERTIVTEDKSTKDQLVFIELSLWDDNKSSRNSLTTLARSIEPISD